ncbi:winged helix DNA-binding domain-containing protein [Mucilaginibacter hurinus]|uniref:Winged helix DNA-binding domain-containing protein n=1 Tax=Mucilaginibacter hurinus TaxID=2201324 RepID=A0A367GUM8_9SPHI|nr:winged helix DNA-binding domain-containing protein [Mucilaginibacter hurinus]RCH56383.1 winged helix DNA-binding domain-containing protein [Mucilaginibacter hurinus]
MTEKDIIRLRLFNQHLSRRQYKNPRDIVSYMGAVQAQDYAGAKWALGMRLNKSNDDVVEKALADGDILRTHVLRPTWHFVVPDDIRWMTELTAPRIHQISAGRNRELKLDPATYKKSNDILAAALAGRQLTRNQLSEILEQNGVSTGTERMMHLMAYAELKCVITSGAREDKQFTYALFDDRVPAAKALSKEEAVIKLAGRYFTSRGPATVHDFAWWSGLTITDARIGIEGIKQDMIAVDIKGVEYFMAAHLPDTKLPAAGTYLLPAYDELTVAYKDRSAYINTNQNGRAKYLIFDPAVVINGKIAGNWKRTVTKNKMSINLHTFKPLNPAGLSEVERAARRFGSFWNVAINVAP